MAVIDIGPGATNRSQIMAFSTVRTVIDVANVANDTGTLDTFEVWSGSSNLTNVKMGTFSGSGTSYNDRDYETIGTVTYGSKQTFTGKNCDVSSGDFLGLYADAGGALEWSNSGYSGVYYYTGDAFGSGSITFTLLSGDAVSIYATGATVEAGGHPTMKRWGGVPFMSLNKGVF